MTREDPDRHPFLLGSTNPGKLREYREILQGLDLELVAPSDLDPEPPEPSEDAHTFAENASSKARAYATATGLQTIADDSGLEVYALRGAPGVRSRRFFGEDAFFLQSVANVLSAVMDRRLADRAVQESERRKAAILQGALDAIEKGEKLRVPLLGARVLAEEAPAAHPGRAAERVDLEPRVVGDRL